MLSSRVLTVPALALSLLAGGCDRQSGDKAQGEPSAAARSAATGAIDRTRKGSELPDFTFSDTAGRSLRLSDTKGKPLLINLWATWCAPCVAELPALDRLAQKDRVRVLTISQDMGQPDKVAAFLQARGVTRLEPWLDPDNELGFHYQSSLPTSILYDATGREVWRVTGPLEWDAPAAATLLAEAGG